MLLLIQKYTNTLNGETKTKPQETIDFTLNKQMNTFPFSPAINFTEEENWLIGVSFLKQRTPFLVKLTKTLFFQFENQDNGLPKDMEKFLKN